MSAEGPEGQADVNEMVDLRPVWRGPNVLRLQLGRQLPDQSRPIPRPWGPERARAREGRSTTRDSAAFSIAPRE